MRRVQDLILAERPQADLQVLCEADEEQSDETNPAQNHRSPTSPQWGGIVALTVGFGDDLGKAVEVSPYTYSPYGISGQEGTSGNPFRYTGRRLDPETGLYYYRARYYSPALGRFLQTDPIGYGDGLNWYAYVQNDPLNRVDPSGRFAQACVIPPIGAICITAAQLIVDAVTVALGAAVLMNDDPSHGAAGDGDEATFPDEIYDRKAPGQREPAGGETIEHGRFNPNTGEYEESTVEYDEYGRQIRREDRSDHGYPEDHDNPHEHETEYGPGYAPGGKQTRLPKKVDGGESSGGQTSSNLKVISVPNSSVTCIGTRIGNEGTGSIC